MSNLFAEETLEFNKQGGSNQLLYTSKLNDCSLLLAERILGKLTSDIQDNNNDNQEDNQEEIVAVNEEEETARQELINLFENSKNNNDAMDQLINHYVDLSEVDVEFMNGADKIILDKMLKSQQSKRSRLKNNKMSPKNYLQLMTAGVAEGLIRIVGNIEKNISKTSTNALELDDKAIQMYSDDQELLKKAIRNVQSKKSMMKQKAGFDEESDEWIKLLEYEQALKELRVSQTSTIPAEAKQKIEKVDKITELLQDKDIDKLKIADAKSIILQIIEIVEG